MLKLASYSEAAVVDTVEAAVGTRVDTEEAMAEGIAVTVEEPKS